MATEFFIRPAESELDKVSDPKTLVERMPYLEDRFDALKELRAIDDGTKIHRGSEFRRVASLVGPIETLMRVTFPEFLADKRKFYQWLDAHPEYATYDRRKHRAQGHLVNGIVVPAKPGEE